MKASHAVGIYVGALLSAGLLCASAHAQDYRETAVPNRQIAAVLRDVAQWHDMQNPKCRYERSLGSVPGLSDQGEPEEHWSIAACNGQQFTYRVSVISQSEAGGVTVLVGNLGGRPARGAPGNNPQDLKQSCEDSARRLAELQEQEAKNADAVSQASFAADSAALSGAISACREQGLLPAEP